MDFPFPHRVHDSAEFLANNPSLRAIKVFTLAPHAVEARILEQRRHVSPALRSIEHREYACLFVLGT